MYVKAEERYRAASSPAERLAALEEMLRLVPKHKGSEKLQAQIKQKIKAAREAQQKGGGKKSAHHDAFHVPRQGAGQVALLGEANVGKSAIVQAVTNAPVEVADFPFSTHAATPGMARHEDVPIQVVDMPPLMPGHALPGMISPYRTADVILLVIDLTAIEILDQFERPLAWLGEHNLRPASQPVLEFDEDESAALPRRLFVAANKIDEAGAADNLVGFRDLCPTDLRIVPVSAKTGQGMKELLAEAFRLLNVIRIYAKKPGKPADRDEPFILPVGSSVYDLAYQVHRELAEQLKTARLWGAGVHDGQQVHATHVLADRNVVELHF